MIIGGVCLVVGEIFESSVALIQWTLSGGGKIKCDWPAKIGYVHK